MGEGARDILEGFVCQFCGEVIDEDAPGYPRSCGCDEDNSITKPINNGISYDVETRVEKILESAGYEIVGTQVINYGFQFRLEGGSIVNIYATGKFAAQGTPDKKLKNLLFENYPYL